MDNGKDLMSLQNTNSENKENISFGDILRQSWKIFIQNFWTFLAIVLLMLSFGKIIQMLTGFGYSYSTGSIFLKLAYLVSNGTTPLIIGTIVTIFIISFYIGVQSSAIMGSIDEKPATIRQYLSETVKRFWSYLALFIILDLILAIFIYLLSLMQSLYLVLIVMAIFNALVFSIIILAACAVFYEKLGVLKALGRGLEIIKLKSGMIFGVLLISLLVVYIPSQLLDVIPLSIYVLAGNSYILTIISIIIPLFFTLLAVFIAIMLGMIYYLHIKPYNAQNLATSQQEKSTKIIALIILIIFIGLSVIYGIQMQKQIITSVSNTPSSMEITY